MAHKDQTWDRVPAPVVFEDVTGKAPRFPFYFRMFHAGPHRNFHYVVGDMDSREAFVVDPTFELERLFRAVEADGFQITRALFTHGHWDHVGGAPEAVDRGVKELIVHELGAGHPRLHGGAATIRTVTDGDRLTLAGMDVEVLHTPGHQPEATCYLVGPDAKEKALFGGDTLFIGSCGRTDFPGGDTDAMFASMARLRGLAGSPGIHVLPGHHYAAEVSRSLSAELVSNPALATIDRSAFGLLACLSD